MTHVDMGTTGAKRQSWEKDNPRELLRRLIEKHPQYSRDRALSEFKKLLDGRQTYIETIVEYWFSNNYASLVDRENDPVQRIKRIGEQTAALREGLNKAVETRVKIVLLDMVMPNGKPLRGCTGKECGEFARTIGAWLARVSKQIRPTDVVGDVLTEKQVATFYKS
jgi:hypothetical protein